MMRLLCLPAFLLAIWCGPSLAAEEVRVGGYLFPPYVELVDGNPNGLTLDVIAAVNAAQDRYRLSFVPIAAATRQADLAAGKYHMILFESPAWGWDAARIAISPPLLQGAEIFVALAQPGRGQGYFRSLKAKRIAAMRGYHYRFAEMVTDPAILKRRFGVELVEDPGDALQAILDEQADIALMSDSYLRRLLHEVPEFADTLLVGDTPDQRYDLSALTAANRRSLMEAIAPLLRDVLDAPDFQPILQGYGFAAQHR